MDILNFYYNNLLVTYKYMFYPLNIITEEIMEQYNLRNITHNEKIYLEIRKRNTES